MRLKLSLSKTLAAAGLVCAVLASAGSAAGSTSGRIKMDVVPLPKWAIGPAAKPLQLSQLSGVVSNDLAASLALDWPGAMGRVTGYMLDYGSPASGGAGITSVRTSIERYVTAADARYMLGLLKKRDAMLGRHLTHAVLTVKSTGVKVPALGKARFAYLTSYRAANLVPFATLDERFLEGKYMLQVQVSAGTAAAAKALAPKLAQKLDFRFKLALKGRLHAQPVQLPPRQTNGPPVDGPDLSAFALSPSDLSGEATLDWAGYVDYSPSGCGCAGRPFPHQELSVYEVDMSLTGPLIGMFQGIEWYATANEAAFRTDLSIAHALTRDQFPFEPFDVSSVGHGAQGLTSSSGHMAEIILNVGQLVEVLWVGFDDPMQASGMLPIAQAAAKHIDARGLPPFIFRRYTP